MKSLKVRTNGESLRFVKQILFAVTLLIVVLPLIVHWGLSGILNLNRSLFTTIISGGFVVLFSNVLLLYLFSRYSCIPRLRLRKQLILFTRLFTTSKEDGFVMHSVKWKYQVKNDEIEIHLYSNALINDKAKTAGQLSEYIQANLIIFREEDNYVRYVFGSFPLRFNALEVLKNENY